MSMINDLPYAAWLEDSLKSLINSDSQSICILSKDSEGNIGSGYWNCSVADKHMFVGFIQNDAMIETLINNGYIDDEGLEDEFEDEEEDVNG